MVSSRHAEREAFISKKLAEMSLEEKVGQLLTVTFRGSNISPSAIDMIEKLHVGGLCLEPRITETCKNLYWGESQIDKDWVNPEDAITLAKTYFQGGHDGIDLRAEEYTEVLNNLQKIAMKRKSRIPLHMTIDFEGDFKNDYASNLIQFPSPMALAAIGDIKTTYRVGLEIGRQLRAVGITQIYSPVCCVNTNPDNPEIGVRAFSDDPKICAEHAAAFVRGLQDGGLIATSKHYPGRGDSKSDAHNELDVITASKKRMNKVELLPFKATIDAGVGAIMTGHSVYPAYDNESPATLSDKVITGLLRKKLGFEGVVVSDAIGMGAILEKYRLPNACAMAIKAGVDTILLKADDESREQCFYGILNAVKKGEISMDRINDANTRLLRMKYNQGLFKKEKLYKDQEYTHKVVSSKRLKNYSKDVAQKAVRIMRGKELLPLDPKEKILSIGQYVPRWMIGNTKDSNPFIFSYAMSEHHSRNLILYDTDFYALTVEKDHVEEEKDQIKEALRLAKGVDTVVMTNYYYRGFERNNLELARELKKAGKKVIVLTNDPYLRGTTDVADAVVCTFSATPESIKAGVDAIYRTNKYENLTNFPIDKKHTIMSRN